MNTGNNGHFRSSITLYFQPVEWTGTTTTRTIPSMAVEVAGLEMEDVSTLLCSIEGKGTQKYKWILFKSIWKTAHNDENYVEIGFLFLKRLRFYVFKMLPLEAAILK